MHHLFVNVQGLAVYPFPGQALGLFHHDFSVGSNSLAVKSWLYEAALVFVDIPFTREKPIAKNGFGDLKGGFLLEILGLDAEDFLNQVGVVQKVSPPGAYLETTNIPMGPGGAGEKTQSVPGKFEKELEGITGSNDRRFDQGGPFGSLSKEISRRRSRFPPGWE